MKSDLTRKGSIIVTLTFAETGLKQEVLAAVEKLGFSTPTPIQQQCIPTLLDSDEDIIGLAQTGTGKTGAFGLPLVHMVDPNFSQVQALILCPTRELCMQITSDLKSYARFIKGIKVVAVYGGASMDTQIRGIKQGAQIVVGTPGRLLDLIGRRALKISQIKWLVLDEADEMLNMGFKEDIDSILSTTPKEKRTLLFSATLPQEIYEIAATYMERPKEIAVGKRNAGADNITHHYYVVPTRDQYETLRRIADIHPGMYSIVFCRTREETQRIADRLAEDGYNASALHGGLSQAQRDSVMGRFRSRILQILVATDVAARGLDVDDLTHIINFGLPGDLEVYIHRSGRTGRAGKEGVSISIVHSAESRCISKLEKMSGKKFKQERIPSGNEVCQKILMEKMALLKETDFGESLVAPYLPAIMETLEGLSRDDLIKAFVSLEFKQILSSYKNASDLNKSCTSKPESRYQKPGRGGNYAKFSINIGSKRGMGAGDLIKFINGTTRNRDIGIGKIRIQNHSSTFEVQGGYEKEIQKAFNGISYEGQPVTLELTSGSTGSSKGSSYRRPGRGASNGNGNGNGKRKKW